MTERSRVVVALGYEYANKAIDYLEDRIPETEREPLDMAVFSGSAASALLATAYKNVYQIKKDPKEAHKWLAAMLSAATEHIGDDFGHSVRVLIVEKNEGVEGISNL